MIDDLLSIRCCEDAHQKRHDRRHRMMERTSLAQQGALVVVRPARVELRTAEAADRNSRWVGNQPVVLAIEDLHSADPTTLDVLRGIAGPGALTPLLAGS
jgi:hypothetical protein